MSDDANGETVFDSLQVHALLIGSEESIAQAFQCLDWQLRLGVYQHLRQRYPTLCLEDVEDAWAETLLRILLAARAGRLPEGSALLGWLGRVATARARDLSRRQEAREQLLESLRNRLVQGGILSGESSPPLDVMDLVAGLQACLSARQRLVLRVFVEHYPQSESMEVLRQEVARCTGQVEPLGGIKRVLQEVRRKARLWMTQNDTGQSD